LVGPLAGHSGAGSNPGEDRTPGSREPRDVRPIGEGVSELRIHYGPGYRVYFTKHGREIVILLAGGDKSTQAGDIRTALRLARNL